MAPVADMMARRLHEHAKAHLPLVDHDVAFCQDEVVSSTSAWS